MQKSDSIKALSKALTAVQKALKPAVKDADNPFFKTKYADLGSVWDACREPLAANGLSVVQGNGESDRGLCVTTLLMHESGEWIQSDLVLPLSKQDPQGVGSALTYGRRYGLAAMIGIVADADDDGNAASTPGKQAQAPPKAVEAPTGRELQLAELKRLAKALNAKGDVIKWSPKVTSEYITEQFGEGITIDNANEAQLKTIVRDLEARLQGGE
jgi:hypothetical protein